VVHIQLSRPFARATVRRTVGWRATRPVEDPRFDKETTMMMNGLRPFLSAVLFLLIAACLPLLGQEKPDEPTQLLNHLAGNWVLEGVLGGRHSTHDVTAEWILNHEYLRFHEVSHEKNKNGGLVYEAIVILSWDNKTNETSRKVHNYQ
jgi:hypothetical protein